MSDEKKLNFDQEPVEETPKKKLPVIAKIGIIGIGSIVGLFVLVWGGLNVLKYPIYYDFYSRKKDVAEIPGLNTNATPQGCTYDSVNDVIYTSSYAPTGAVIYTVKGKKSYSHVLYRNGKPFKGHVGGVATSGNLFYIANDSRIFTISTSSLMADDKANIEIGEGQPIQNQSSFVYADDNYVYAGEFHDGKQYQTENIYGDNHAIVEKFKIEDFTIGATTEVMPEQCISIRNKVQGFTITNEGKYVLSTSFGLASSHFYIYNADKLTDTGTTMHGAPLMSFSEVSKDLLAPAMMEDLDIYKDGTVITLTESASNKYIFGKFFFANHIISVKI